MPSPSGTAGNPASVRGEGAGSAGATAVTEAAAEEPDAGLPRLSTGAGCSGSAAPSAATSIHDTVFPLL